MYFEVVTICTLMKWYKIYINSDVFRCKRGTKLSSQSFEITSTNNTSFDLLVSSSEIRIFLVLILSESKNSIPLHFMLVCFLVVHSKKKKKKTVLANRKKGKVSVLRLLLV